MLDPTPTVVSYVARQASRHSLPNNLAFHPWGLSARAANVTMRNWWTHTQWRPDADTAEARAELAQRHRHERGDGGGAGSSGGGGGTRGPAVASSTMLTITEVRRRLGGQPPTVLKLDVEGAEWEIATLLPACGAQQLMFELHGFLSRWLELLAALSHAGYTLYRVEDGRLAPLAATTSHAEPSVYGNIVLYLVRAAGAA